jgi:ABC-type sulfate/molybdate transport systems ATPase subunit
MGLQVDIIKKLSGFNLQVCLSCEQGIIGVLGASGAGKSMLLKCIAGLVDPDEGYIKVNGKTFFDSDKKINLPPRERTAGFLFQNYALFPHLTIEENIAFGLDNLSKADKHKKVEALMERFNIAGMGKRYPSQISGGQQQRVALARAMAVEPEILLLDEPFSALDNHLKNYLIKDMSVSLKEFKGNTLFVTHNMEEAYRLCDRLAVLSSGSVEAFGLKEEIFQKPASFETAKITGCKNITAAVRKSNYTTEITNWCVTVKTNAKITSSNGFIGIRANHIMLADGTGENCFPVWIADESESPFRTSLYLKIGSAANSPDDYHLQWEISRDQRETLRSMAQPFYIYLDPRRVFFVQD